MKMPPAPFIGPIGTTPPIIKAPPERPAPKGVSSEEVAKTRAIDSARAAERAEIAAKGLADSVERDLTGQNDMPQDSDDDLE